MRDPKTLEACETDLGTVPDMLTRALAADRTLRVIFWEIIDTADGVISSINNGAPLYAMGDDDEDLCAGLFCEIDEQLHYVYPVDDDLYEVIYDTVLDYIFRLTAGTRVQNFQSGTSDPHRW